MGQKKSRKIPSKSPTKFSKFPCEKSKKFTDELLQERRENNSRTTPQKIPLDEEGLLWGWCVVGGPLSGGFSASGRPSSTR